MTSACPGVHLHFLLCIVGQKAATMLSPRGCDLELVKSHDVYTQKTCGFPTEEVSLTERCQLDLKWTRIFSMYFLKLPSVSVFLLKMENPAAW